MAKNSVIKLPNGVTIEITPDFKPEQINAIISSVIAGERFKPEKREREEVVRDPELIWHTSKKEKVAMFIRNYFSPTLWFSAKDLLEEQLQVVRSIVFGETSQIGTYLKRLYEEKFLERKTYGRLVKYKMNETFQNTYPRIPMEQMNSFIMSSIE